MDWTRLEVELVVADYFAMLLEEMAGRRVDKSAHRRALKPLLKGRSEGSIEFKHQNISAVLINFRQPFIAGYLPRQNYQMLLEQVVLEWLAGHPRFFAALADGPVLSPASCPELPTEGPVSRLIEAPPDVPTGARPARPHEPGTRFYRQDYVRRDAENRRLGRLGEEWVVEFERRRLHDEEKRSDLAGKVEWTADTRGDGAGYDITSFNSDESSRLIEVKTTGLGKWQPFLLTANELAVSNRLADRYVLYRVFEFSKAARLYQLPGDLGRTCHLDATLYSALPRRR